MAAGFKTGGRKKGTPNKVKKPEFIRLYERYRRATKHDPVATLFHFASGRDDNGDPIQGITTELRFKANATLVQQRYPAVSVSNYEEDARQQDMFDSVKDDRLDFGVVRGIAS